MEASEVKTASTAALIKFFNEKTGQNVKRFSTRAAAERRVLEVIEGKMPKARKAPEKKPTVAAKPRKVRGAAGSAGDRGRPKLDFIVKLNSESTAESKPHAASLRTKLIKYLEGREERRASIGAIEKHFNRDMRGVVGKLMEKKWVQRLAAA